MSKPKDDALSFLILARGDLAENLVDLVELKTLADRVKGVNTSHLRLDFDWFYDRICLTRATLCGQSSLEMIVDDIGAHYF